MDPRTYQFKLLSQQEQDEMLAVTLLAQERDLYAHLLNLDRFNEMLQTLPAGEFRDRITQLRDETQSRIAEVSSIIEALEPQLPPPARLATAKARLEQREQQAQGL